MPHLKNHVVVRVRLDGSMELASATETEVITTALEDFIRKFKIREIKNYRGSLELDIDIAAMRAR